MHNKAHGLIKRLLDSECEPADIVGLGTMLRTVYTWLLCTNAVLLYPWVHMHRRVARGQNVRASINTYTSSDVGRCVSIEYILI